MAIIVFFIVVIASTIGYVLVTKDKRQQDKAEKERDKAAQSIIGLLGYKACDKNGILTKENGTYTRYLRVGSTDLFNIDLDGLMAWIQAFTFSERNYTEDHKLVSVTARVDTSANQLYWQHLRQNTGRTKQEQMRLALINENQDKAAAIEQDTKDYVERVYAIQIFGKTKKQLRKLTNNLIISNGNIYSIRPMDKEETVELQERLYNMNSR